MHPAVLLVLILVAGIFAALGALVLWLTPWPGLSRASLIWFVVSALVGAVAYVLAFDAISGRIRGGFGSDTNEVLFVLSVPLVGSLVGCWVLVRPP
jgi:hypothetical protein